MNVRSERIALLTLYVASIEIFIIVIFGLIFNYFGVTQSKIEAYLDRKNSNKDINTAFEYLIKKSEKEFTLWNEKDSTNFIFPIEFNFNDTKDFEIRYNSEYNEDLLQQNENLRFSGMPIGTYNFPKLSIGRIVMKNIENRINEFFEKNENGIIKIKVRGTSDNIPASNNAKYIGDLGYGNINYHKIEGNLIIHKTRILSEDTPLTNEDFALLRAYSIVDYFKKKFDIKDENIQIYVQIFKEKGPKYRNCDFWVTLENYFEYNILDRP